MTTIGEEIKAWTKEYNESDNLHKFVMQQLAAAEYFKAEQIWEFVQAQPEINPKTDF